MKIKNGFILRSVAGNNIIIGTGDEAIDFNGMITINETGVFLWRLLENGISREELIEKLLAEYEVDRETAEKDIDEFIEKLHVGKLIEDDE